MEKKRDVEWIRACLAAYAQSCANTKAYAFGGSVEKMVRFGATHYAADESDIQYAMSKIRATA